METETRRHSAPPDLPPLPDRRRNPPLPPAWPWPYRKHTFWRAWAEECWHYRNLHLIAIALLLACSALGGWLHGGVDGYLAQPPPLFYAAYASHDCALLAVRQLHYPDFHRSLFPAPLQDSLRFLSVSDGTAKSQAKRYLPCFGPDKCRRNPGLNSTECVDIILIAHDAAEKLQRVVQYPPAVYDTTQHDSIIPEESPQWQRYLTLEQVRRPRYNENRKTNTRNKHLVQPCQCTVGRAVSDAVHQVATRRYPSIPATLTDAAEQGWCPCDITSAFEPYDYVLATTIPDLVTGLITDILTKPFDMTRWSSLTFRPERLPPRRIHSIWFSDTAWHVQRPTWSSSPSIASYVWGHMAAMAQQRFVNRLRGWGRDDLEYMVAIGSAEANLTAEERVYLKKMGWVW